MAEPVYREPARMPRIDRSWNLPSEAELPYDDGNPLPDGDYQREPLGDVFYGLRDHFAERADVAVHSDMFVHYLAIDDAGEVLLDDTGQPIRRMLAPDVFIALGVPQRMRNSYVTWDEGKVPDFVLEVLSESTWRHDIGAKKEIYERQLGVREYWVVDPYGTWVEPPRIKGYGLVGRRYEPVSPLPGGGVAFHSEVLGLELRMVDGVFRIRDPSTGDYLRGPRALRDALEAETRAARHREGILRKEVTAAREEVAALRRRESSAREASEAAARHAEKRIAELEARLWRAPRDG